MSPKYPEHHTTGQLHRRRDAGATLLPFGQTAEPDGLWVDLCELSPVGRSIEYWCAVAVAEELHFTRAAHRLHIDQSALSRHVQKLESALGFKLFIRGNRRIELTEAAELFIPFARKALLAASAGVRVAQVASRGEPQELEVGYSTAVDTRVVAGMKSLIEEAGLGIAVRFRSFPDQLLVGRLFDGSSHIAIALMPIEAEVAATCILREQIYLVVPDCHEMVGQQSVSLGQIGDSPVVWPTGAMAAAVSLELFTRFRRFGYSPNVKHEAQTVAEALGLVREGVGVTFVKESDLVFVGARLIPVQLDTKVHIETGLIHVREVRWDSLRTFIATVASQFRLQGTSEGQKHGAKDGGGTATVRSGPLS